MKNKLPLYKNDQKWLLPKNDFIHGWVKWTNHGYAVGLVFQTHYGYEIRDGVVLLPSCLDPGEVNSLANRLHREIDSWQKAALKEMIKIMEDKGCPLPSSWPTS